MTPWAFCPYQNPGAPGFTLTPPPGANCAEATPANVSWRGVDLLCGGGWFVVDAAAHEGDTLKSIDLRFEMECGLPTSLLRNYVYFESQLDPSLGPPQKYLYTPDNSQIFIDAGVALLMVRVIGDKQWSGELQGMNSLSMFEVGYYGDLQRYREPDNSN